MATVAFTAADLVQLVQASTGVTDETAEEVETLIAMMREVRHHNHREIGEAMEAADALLEGSGVEGMFIRGGRVVTDPWGAEPGIDYVNLGDTYIATIIYDYELHAFRIGTWGDWVETTEAQLERERRGRDAEVCSTCGADFNPQEEGVIDEDVDGRPGGATCGNCVRDREVPPPPTWRPSKAEPLIAVLRSVEGHPVAVHRLLGKGSSLILAFSVMQTSDHFIAASHMTPFTNTWENVIDAFERRGMLDLYVCGTGRGQHDVSIETEMFSRLRVAMDAFFESGMTSQPVREFLAVPPVVWTCNEIIGCVWDEERGEAMVECYASHDPDRGDDDPPGAQYRDLSIWSARSPELDSLIEDGFIRWEDDDSVRKYLRERGLCRAK